MKRREFLAKAGQAAAMAAVAGDLVLINNGCQSGDKRKATRYKGTDDDDQTASIAIAERAPENCAEGP